MNKFIENNRRACPWFSLEKKNTLIPIQVEYLFFSRYLKDSRKIAAARFNIRLSLLAVHVHLFLFWGGRGGAVSARFYLLSHLCPPDLFPCHLIWDPQCFSHFLQQMQRQNYRLHDRIPPMASLGGCHISLSLVLIDLLDCAAFV